jgi:hypothetical protein
MSMSSTGLQRVRPTLYRMLGTLMRRGFVQLSGDPPCYRLDYSAARLAEAWSKSTDIGQSALLFLETLLQCFDETVALYLRRENSRVCVAELPSRQPLSYARGSGTPKACGAAPAATQSSPSCRMPNARPFYAKRGSGGTQSASPHHRAGARAWIRVELGRHHRGGSGGRGAGVRSLSDTLGSAGPLRSGSAISSRTGNGMRGGGPPHRQCAV